MAEQSMSETWGSARWTRHHRESTKGRLLAGLARVAWRPSPVLVGGAVGLIVTGELTATSASVAPMAMVWTGTATVVLLTLLTAAACTLVSRAGSRFRHVFCARRIALGGLALAAMATLFATEMFRRGPFVHATTRLRVGASDIADLGLLVAVVICVVLAGVAMFDAWDARRDERSWHLSIAPAGAHGR